MVLSQVAVKILVAGLPVMNLSFDELLPDYLLQLYVFLLKFHYTKGRLAENRWLERSDIISMTIFRTKRRTVRDVLFAKNFEKFQVLYACDNAFEHDKDVMRSLIVNETAVFDDFIRSSLPSENDLGLIESPTSFRRLLFIWVILLLLVFEFVDVIIFRALTIIVLLIGWRFPWVFH